jgi:hypothetical protein
MMSIRWGQWIVGCFLLGILSRGYAGYWTPKEDEIIIEFMQACRLNSRLTWQDCADKVNQYLDENEADYRRTAIACSKRWSRYLRDGKGCKPHNPRQYCWTEDENARFIKSVRRNINGRWIKWKGVSLDMGNLSAAQCREHYGALVSHGFSLEETPEEEEQQNGRPDAVDLDIPILEEIDPDIPVYEEFEDPEEDSFFGGY